MGLEVRELAAVVATLLAAGGALPQLRRLLTSRDVAGLSISSAALGVGTELAWICYAVHEGLWLAVPEAVMMAATNGLLAVVMLRAGAPGRGALLSGVAWTATLIATSTVWGSIGLAGLLAVAYVVQVAPAIWCVYRVKRPTGVAVGTWVLIGVESVLWGLYGWRSHDLACLAFGVAGSAAAVAIVGRVVTTRRRQSPSGSGALHHPRQFSEQAVRIGDAFAEGCSAHEGRRGSDIDRSPGWDDSCEVGPASHVDAEADLPAGIGHEFAAAGRILEFVGSRDHRERGLRGTVFKGADVL